MKYHIYRTHLSGYWPKNFLDLEARQLTLLEQCSYHGLELDATKWQNMAIILSNTHFNPALISTQDWAKVSLVLHANSGFDNLLSQTFLNAYKGTILIAPSLRAQAVAEYNLQAWLAGLGQIPFNSTWDKQRLFPRKLAAHQQVLIIGFGHVGKLTHQMIQATGAKVEVYDPYLNQAEFVSQIEWEKYNSILFCCSLTKSSQTLMDQNIWLKLNPECILINSSRGAIINMEHATQFAKTNPKSKIFLDVFEPEPFLDYDKLPVNIYTSSHIAGVYDQLTQATHQWHHDTIKDFINLSSSDFLKQNKIQDLRQQRLSL